MTAAYEQHMRELTEATFASLRTAGESAVDRLETPIRDAPVELGRIPDGQELRRLAIACNAVIDRLWLEGSALPDTFAADELAQIGLDGRDRRLDLQNEVKQS